MDEVFISYSQNFEDVILYRALKGVDKGFYIDVGAWDPVVDSVTKAFYDRGWRGINIEPVRAFYEKLLADRPEDVNLMVAVGSRNGLVRFFEVVDTGLSTTNEELAKRYMQEGYEVRELLVPCMRLADICKDYGVQEVHFLKIDVEGAEKEVLEGFDFSRIRPWIVIVEATEASTQKETFKDWESLLLNQDYEFVYYDGLNRFYVARERSELKEAFKLPPNLWDGFVRYHEWKLQREVEHAQAEREALARQVEELREVVRRAEAERISQEAQLAELSRALNALQAEKEKLWAEREALARQVGELWEVVRRAEAERISQEAQLAELSRALNALQAEKEKLRAEREALARQVGELDRWLKAVYATVSWRITAPLRLTKRAVVTMGKHIWRAFTKLEHWTSRLALRGLGKIAYRAFKSPRLRSSAKQFLRRTQALQARVRLLVEKGAFIRARVDAESRASVVWISTWNSRCGIAAYSKKLVQKFPIDKLHVLANRTNDLVSPDEAFVERVWEIGGPCYELIERIKQLKPRAVVIQYNFNFFPLEDLGRVITATKEIRAAAVVFMHGTRALLEDVYQKQLLRSRHMLNHATLIMVHTPQDLQNLKAAGIEANAIVFPHGVDLSLTVSTSCTKVGLFQAKRVIASFGFLLPHKGILELVRAFQIVHRQHPDTHLLLINALYPLEVSNLELQRLDALVTELGLAEHVTRFHRYLPDEQVLDLLQGATLIVFPYQHTLESTSAAVRVGLASGRPVAVTPLPIFDELGEAVYRFSGTSVEEIAQGLHELLSNPTKLKALEMEARKWAAERDFAALSQQLWQLLEEMDQQRSSSPSLESLNMERDRKRFYFNAVFNNMRGFLLKILAKVAKWASQDPRLRSLGKRLLQRAPTLQFYVRRLLMQGAPTLPGNASEPQTTSTTGQVTLSESAREVFDELAAAMARLTFKKDL